jgi:glucosamine--fructose-6-phosphate aminotransferase (isomerizing)
MIADARGGHPYHMHDAIYAQPGALRLAARGNAATLAASASRVAAAERVVVTGVGSSWHAALVGEHLLAHAGGLGPRVRAVHAFELARYGPPPDTATAVIALSHRGATRDVLAALETARRAGAATIGISGKGAPLGAEHALFTVEQEKSEAHTVGYTTALALLAGLAAAAGDEGLARGLESVPDLLALLLGQEAWEELAQRHGARRRYYVVGGGPNTATAYEAALKLQETSYVPALGLNCEEFLHGPWVALEAEDLLVVLAPRGPSRATCLDAARAARAIGAGVVMLAPEDDREANGLATESIALPEVDELLSPLLAIAPLQLLAYHVAVRRGANPDTMRADSPPHARARAARGA